MKSKPNFELAQEGAYDLIYEAGISDLPIDVERLITEVVGLNLITYTEMAALKNFSFEDIYELSGSNDGFIIKKGSTYLIAYNDRIQSEGRKRFTLAHELAHYKLGHLEEIDNDIISRNGLSEDQYVVLEKEANYFAKRLLAPIPLVDDYRQIWKTIDYQDISLIFNTSLTFGRNLINDLIRRSEKTNIVRTYHNMNINFKRFIYIDTHMNTCETCHNLVDNKQNFCEICGAEQTEKNSYDNYYLKRKERHSFMKYSKAEVNYGGYATTCPKCCNDHLDTIQQFCQICGSYLQNQCVGDLDMVNNTSDLKDITGCGYVDVEGDARYCPECGGETAFGFTGLLKEWRTEHAYQENFEF